MAALFGGWGADPFSDLVDKATSELLPAGQEDIALNLEICDQVRAKQVPPKQAMQTIKKRLGHKNPNVTLLALGLTDLCIKNGGDHFLAEVASREFMDNLVSILRIPAGVNNDVKNKALGLIQNWSQIAQAKPQQMGYISDTYKSLKLSGFDFPPMDPRSVVSAALVETMTAPEWTDSDVCMRCRTAFTTFNRKHHCRNCGNVFCQDCSSKTMALPWFGVGQDVRVCDGCFSKKAPPNKASKLSRSVSTHVPVGRGGVGSHQRSRTMDSGTRQGSSKSKEEDDLALAIKLSLEASGSGSRPGFVASQPLAKEGRPTRQADGRMLEGTDADDDPDLAAAIAASLRDYAAPTPSAPDGFDEGGTATPRPGEQAGRQYVAQEESRLPLPPSLELPASDVDALLSFAQNASSQEAFARQHGQWQGPQQQYQTQELYEKATAARPRMARSLDEATRRHGVLISMHDKLTEAVRLYDRLLDAQMSRPAAQYASPYYAAPSPYPTAHAQAGYVGESSMYPTLPGGGGGYGGEHDQHHHARQHLTSPHQAGIPSHAPPMESPNPYHGHQTTHYFASQQAPYRPELTHSQYSQQAAPMLQQGAAVTSAPAPPSSSSSTSQMNSSVNGSANHWHALDALPSAPTNTAASAWTNLSPPSQEPAHGSLYGNLPSLPQFEALPAHEQQPTVASPTLAHRSNGMAFAEEADGWRDAPIKTTAVKRQDADTQIDGLASPYTTQPWSRPVETPLIDL